MTDLVYRTDGPWGAGKGSNLTPAQADGNFYNLDQRVEAVETNPPAAISIADISVVGTQMTITLSNGTPLGPFTLPTLTWKWQGVWQPDPRAYAVNDVVVFDSGVYLVRVPHGAAATFDPARLIDGVQVYQQLIAPPGAYYDIAFFYPGIPGHGASAGSPMLAFRVGRVFYLPEGLVNSQAGFRVDPSATLTFSIKKNGTEIGTWSSDGGFTFDEDVQFTAGDMLTVDPPTGLYDPEAARDFTITLAGVRGVIPT